MSTLPGDGKSGKTPELPEHAWALSVKEVCRALAADSEQGLTEAEVQSRRKRFGSNSLETGTRQSTLRILWRQFQSVIMLVLAGFAFALIRLGYTEREAVTVSFVAISLARLWHVFNMRDAQTHVVLNQITGNGFVWIALGICIVLILLALYVPVLRDVLKLATPTGLMWPLILGTSALPLLFGQIALFLAGRFSRRNIS